MIVLAIFRFLCACGGDHFHSTCVNTACVAVMLMLFIGISVFFILKIQNGMFGRIQSTLFFTMKGNINGDKRHLQPVVLTRNI
jgi:hypothetical protein